MDVPPSAAGRDGRAQRGLGMAVAVPEEVILTAASAVARSGYHSFWLNNPPGTNALPVLGTVGKEAPAIDLGVGVIPLSEVSPDEIAQRARQSQVPLDRLYLGVGSGSGPGGVKRVEEGVRDLRSSLGGRIVVAAMGPSMCRLAGRTADAVLFNWITPQFAQHSTQWVREGAEQAARSLPRLMAYVRVALGDEARAKLAREASNYSSIPQYAAHFERMGTPALDTAVTGTEPGEIQRGLAAWNGIVDEIVVRAITAHDTADELTELVEAARPGA